MKTNIIKLGTIVRDTATGRDGMLTHLQVALDHAQDYNFQPCALNPESGGPVSAFWLKKERLANFTTEPVDLPLEVLGSIVTEKATGFTGKAVNIIMHASGCVHVDIQPAGILAKDGASICSHNFSIHRLTGAAIPELSAQQVAQEQSERPSPADHSRCHSRCQPRI